MAGESRPFKPLNIAVLVVSDSRSEKTDKSGRLLCERLAAEYLDRGAGITLHNVAGGWRLTTHPDAAPVVEQYVLASRHVRLTKAALETLAIVAYKQPVTRHQISGVRGVNTEGVLRALVDRGLVAEVGREETPGRPVLYGTTPEFLERLGLPSLSSLPSLAPLLQPSAGASDAKPAANRNRPEGTR